MYKNPEKQKIANKQAAQRRRNKAKGMTVEGMTVIDDRPGVIPGHIPGDELAELETKEREFKKLLLDLPPNVTRPTGCYSRATSNMTSGQIQRAVSRYHGLDWVASNEYAEVIHRLLTRTVEQLNTEGQHIPAWRTAA